MNMAKNTNGPNYVAPEVKPDPHSRGTIETHPAYATIRVGRGQVGGGGLLLFGSDFGHGRVISITISRAERRRDLSNDWLHPRQELIEVALTEPQWATFVSSAGVGEGTPCTLERLNGELVPRIEQLTDRRRQFQDEVQDHMKLVLDSLDSLDQKIDQAGLSGKRRDELKALVHTARRNVGGNLDFVADQFDEHMEATVERAKAEINGHIGTVLQKAGLKQLAADLPTPAVPMLMDGQAEPECPGPDCQLCNGEACRTHGTDPCSCDVVERHQEPGGDR